MEFIIITGLSGAGKTRTIHAFEDIGFYCVDNIPAVLIPTFYDLCLKANSNNMEKVAIVTDIRGGNLFNELFTALEKLKNQQKPYQILFLEARNDILMKRFKESRRSHPFAEKYKGETNRALKLEKELLRKVREHSDFIIDTSFLSPAQLKERISSLFLNSPQNAMSITCVSFGFKFGIPTEADFICDVRCLPNPFYIEELKPLTGLDESVKDYVLKWEQTKGFIARFFDLIDYMLPLYKKEGKSQLTIAIGCTGGKHRSVALSQLLSEHIAKNSINISVIHRDMLQ